MNNIINDVYDLKEIILNTDEYNNYINSKKIINNSSEIKKIINEIIKLQKIIANKEYKKIDAKDEIDKLNILNKKLYSYKEYNKYIDDAKKLNILLSDIVNKFNIYFNSLIN